MIDDPSRAATTGGGRDAIATHTTVAHASMPLADEESTMQAIRVHATGGPDALQLDEIPTPEPGRGEVRIRVTAAGLNFIDTYQRSGAYTLDLPAVLGQEAAGTIDALGEDVRAVSIGDRVAVTGVLGTYAQQVVVPADRLVPVPDDLELEVAAALMLQGLTAHYLTHSTYPLHDGDWALVTAASGGVGHLLVQLAKERGARVIGTVSTDEKERLAYEAGCDEVIRYTTTDLVPAVREATASRGVDVVYDSVGRDTFVASLDCLRPRGMLVLYGQSSGAVPPVDPQVLNRKGSLYLTRPKLGDYIEGREELLGRAREVFRMVAAGDLHVRIDRTFPLAEAADAHRYIEGRQTKGKVLLVP